MIQIWLFKTNYAISLLDYVFKCIQAKIVPFFAEKRVFAMQILEAFR